MRLKGMLLSGLFAAMTALLSQIVIPIGPIPVNFATLSVLLASSLLGIRRGVLSQGIYLLLGLVGLPVFHGFQGGVGILAGPTGGFLIGYLACAFVTGWMIQKKTSLLPAMIVGMGVCYCFGCIWFWYVIGGTVWSVLTLCVFPFLLGDGLKIFIAYQITKRLKGKISL